MKTPKTLFEELVSRVEGLGAEFQDAEAEYHRKKLAYEAAAADLKTLNEIQSRYQTGGETRPPPTPFEVIARDNEALLEIASDHNRRKAKSRRKKLTDEQLAEADQNAAELLLTMEKTDVLFIIASWILRQQADGIALSPREIVRNMPPTLRKKYNPNETVATENVRQRLRSLSRPLRQDSDLQLKDGLFSLAKSAKQ